MLFSFDEQGKGTRVRYLDLYTKEKCFGLVTEKTPFVSGLGNHFILPSYYEGEEVVRFNECEEGVFIDQASSCKRLDASSDRLVPLMFAADVPEYGNYKVKMKLLADGEVIVFAGSRRLVFRKVFSKKTNLNIVFDLNVSRIIPRGQTAAGDRRTVFVSVLGKYAVLNEIEIIKEDCPTLFICGDSTVTDQPADYPYSPGTSYSGWGQMLPCHIYGLAVSNHAHSGLTTESFRSEGHYDIVRKMLQKGDYVMFQFAHNDQKLPHLKAKEGYRQRLVEYIDEVRAAGAFPLIVTPLARNTWKADNGGYNDLLLEYADECMAIGEEYGVPVIDLHDFSMKEILRDGLESSKRFYFPKDYTHTNDYGAYKMSDYIADELTKLKGDYETLAEASVPDYFKWTVNSVPVVPEVPKRFKDKTKEETPSAFKDVDRPDDRILRAEALDMVIKAAKFFPTNVFNDIYDDIVGHEWYAGTVQCGYQNGLIPAGMIPDRRFRPEEEIVLEDFICFFMSAYGSRKKLPEVSESRYDNVCKDYSRDLVRTAVSLGFLKEDDDLKRTLTRREAADICGRMGV